MRRLLFSAEALVALVVSSALIVIVPFRRVARLIGTGAAAEPVDPAVARRIERQLARWARRVPWHAMCFQQGVAAQLMLRRRRRVATLHYGAARDAEGRLVAHVWVTSGPVDVTGCAEAGQFGLLATFPPGR